MRFVPRKLKIAALVSAIGVGLGAAALPGVSVAAPVILPTPDCGFAPEKNCAVFDDAIVYSLPLLKELQKSPFNLLAGYQFVAKPNEGLIFVTRFNASGTKVQGNNTLIDDPYDAWTSSSKDSDNNGRFLFASHLQTGQFGVPTDPPGGPGTNDNIRQSATTVLNSNTYTSLYDSKSDKFTNGCFDNMNGCLPLWDADVGALRSVLNANNSDLVFFFQMNETGDSGELAGQDMLVWARVYLTNSATGETKVFTVSGNNVDIPALQSDPQTTDVDDILPTADDLWAHVHSDICVDNTVGSPTFAQSYLGACTDPSPPKPFVGGTTVDQALGADEATFAIFFPELSALVKDAASGFDVMTIDLRMSHLNDGGDQLWIGATQITREPPPPPPVPEPGTLALFGASLASLGFLRWRRRRGAFS